MNSTNNAGIDSSRSGPNRFGHDKSAPWQLSIDPLFIRNGQFASLSFTDDGPTANYDVRSICKILCDAYHDPSIAPHFYHETLNLDGSPRKIRTDGMAAAIQLMRAALVAMDWASGRIGYYSYDKSKKEYFHSRSLSFLGVSARMPHKAMPGSNIQEQYKLAQKNQHLVDHKVHRASVLLSKVGFWQLGRRAVEYHRRDSNGSLMYKADGVTPDMAWASLPYVKKVNKDFLRGLNGVSNQMIKRLERWSTDARARAQGKPKPVSRIETVRGNVYYLATTEPAKLANSKTAISRLRPMIAAEFDGTLSHRQLMNKTLEFIKKNQATVKPISPDKPQKPPNKAPPPDQQAEGTDSSSRISQLKALLSDA